MVYMYSSHPSFYNYFPSGHTTGYRPLLEYYCSVGLIYIPHGTENILSVKLILAVCHCLAQFLETTEQSLDANWPSWSK